MKKLSFNVQGFHILQLKLFRLTDPALAVEISMLRTNPKRWLQNQFDLSAEEQAAIEQLNEQFLEYLAIRLSNRFALRKSIRFTIINVKSFLEKLPKNVRS